MIPAAIQALLPQHPGEENRIGHSGAQVVMYEDCVLKVQPDTGNAANEGIMLRFLKGRLPVPEVLAEAVQGGMRYLLMTRLRGRMLSDETFLDNQPLLARRMADAAEMLWNVDIAGCPCSYVLDDVLQKAEADIAAGRVTIDTANQPETYGAGGFASPEALLAWLKANRPPETLVLSHGDFCLPNILADEKGIVGFLDLGQAGCADRWRDLDQGLWSMWANTTGLFGGRARPFERNTLFSALNLPLDEEKLRYYSLLSELCP